jgi:subtilisin-like proprotein convertase family protein
LYHATVKRLIGKFKRWHIERVFQQKKKRTKERKKEICKKKSTTEAAKTSNCNSETSTLFGRVESGKENTRRKDTAC